MKKLLLFVVTLLFSVSLFAAEYGIYTKSSPIRYVVTSGDVKGYATTDMKAKVVKSFSAGDRIYVNSDKRTMVDGMPWIQVSGEEIYVFARYLTMESNPNYVYKAPQQAKKSQFHFGFYDLPKWLGWTLLLTWLIMALAGTLLSVNMNELLRHRYRPLNKVEKFLCSIFYFPLFIGWRVFPGWVHNGSKARKTADYKEFKRKYNRKERKNHLAEFCEAGVPVSTLKENYGNGMRKILFYNKEPYICFLKFAMIVILAFFATILLFLILGGLIWLFCWIARVAMVGLFWILVVALGLGALAGVFVAIFSDELGCFGKILALAGGLLAGFLSLAMVRFGEDVADWGLAVVEWGNYVFSVFNIGQVGLYLVSQYWLTALILAVTPLLLFLACAVVFFIFAESMIAYENIRLKKYNVSHPCPVCQEPSEPATYLSHGYELPVPLRPSVWGLFHITHPATGEKMPTLFMNGKDRLERRCKHCDRVIGAEIGTEKHIAVAGVANSGKTVLLDRMMAEILRLKYGCFTDDLGEHAASITSVLDSIKNGEKMSFKADKTEEGRRRSIQFLVEHSGSSLPYRLFLDDVAGEMFTYDGVKSADAAFMKNTDTLILLIDPFTLRHDDLVLSQRMDNWYGLQDKKALEATFNFIEAVQVLANLVKDHRNSKEIAKMKLMVSFVKTDAGYLKGVDTAVEENLRQFAIVDFGLSAAITSLENLFGNNISYHAISAWESVKVSGFDNFLNDCFEKTGIEVKKITPVAESSSKKSHKTGAQLLEDARFKKFDKNSFGVFASNHYSAIMSAWAVGLFALTTVLITTGISISNSISKKNYAKAMASVTSMMKQPCNYEPTIKYIDNQLNTMSFSDEGRKALAKKRTEISTERQNKVDDAMSVLYTNLVPKSGMSNAEISAKYGALDTLRGLKEKLDELEKLVPDDQEYLGYKKRFEDLLKKYRITL